MSLSTKQTQTIATLARSAPEAWAAFVQVANDIAGTCMAEMVRAPAVDVLAAQGRAQQAVAFAEILETAVSTADRVDRRRTTQPGGL